MLTIIVTICLLSTSVAHAAWPHDPLVNVPLCVASSGQQRAASITDGSGGAIVVWEDFRNGVADLYAQRVNAAGVVMWTPGGIPLCTAAGAQTVPVITSDGSGGAIVAWQDARGTPIDVAIYAQRISAAGSIGFEVNGRSMNTYVIGNQATPAICSDGAGGAIVVWTDQRVGPNTGVRDLYAGRITTTSTISWNNFGVAVCAAANDQNAPTIAADGSGGAVMVWADNRSDAAGDIYAQRLNASGTSLWVTDGVMVCNAALGQSNPKVVGDGLGGARIAWSSSNGVDQDVVAGAVNALGNRLTSSDGVPVCTLPGFQGAPFIASDGAGGLFAAWEDQRIAGRVEVYAQRIGANNAPLWASGGVGVCNIAGFATSIAIVADGSGGAIVGWSGLRSGLINPYAQGLSPSGAMLWSANGVPLSLADGSGDGLFLVPDGGGGAIATWSDSRSGERDIYAQSIDHHGPLGDPDPRITGVRDAPNDQGGWIELSWSASYLDAAAYGGVSDYRLWRSVPTNGPIASAMAVRRGITSDPDEAATDGKLLASFTASSESAWEFIQTSPPTQALSYTQALVSFGDSLPGSNPRTQFMVEARGTPAQHWFSSPDSGYSVDNLAPQSPNLFTGAYGAGQTHLSWGVSNEADFAAYRLHRGATTAFTPDGSNLVVVKPDTGYTDVTGTQWVYKLLAVDVHGNASVAAVASPSGVLDVDADPLGSAAFALPDPNPARLDATLRFALPRPTAVRLALHDLAGRRVRTLLDGPVAAGEHVQRIHLHDESGRQLAPGIYLVRFEAEHRTFTRRLVVVR